MTRQTLIASALFLFAGAAAVAPAPSAAAAGPHYRAETAAAPGAEKVVVRGLLWHCDGAVCVAGKGNSRPAIECAALVRKVGALRSFSVAGEALAPEALEKCHGRGR
ncbi:MAG: CC_3452 family protein [Allosphingosinicella sp.]